MHNVAAATANKTAELDQHGTKLWNLGANIKDKDGNGGTFCLGKLSLYPLSCTTLIKLVRVFAFFLIECGHQAAERRDWPSRNSSRGIAMDKR